MKGLWLLDQDGWLESYDPDGGLEDISYPTGAYGVTTDPTKALAFEDFADAMACWQQQSRRTPLRPDGRPNKPLTAFSVLVKDL